MSSPNAVLGWLEILFVAILAPTIFLAVYPGWKTGAALTIIGLCALGGIMLAYRQRGAEALATIGREADRIVQSLISSSQGNGKAGRIPRPNSYWKAQLIEAVGGQCEMQHCKNIGHLEVHHIEEHANGGGNTLHNLLVLCPNDHKMAGSGAINKTRQRTLARRRSRFSDATFSNRWSRSVLKTERKRSPEPDLGISW